MVLIIVITKFGEFMKKTILILTLSFLLGLSIQSANAAHCAGGHDKAKETKRTNKARQGPACV